MARLIVLFAPIRCGLRIAIIATSSLTACASAIDRQHAREMESIAQRAANIECGTECRQLWEAAREWATYSPHVKRVDLEPRQINVTHQVGQCRVNMTADLLGDRIHIRGNALPYGLLYSRTCTPHHAVIEFSQAIQSTLQE